jgi:capsular polysaccharide biosynthesis protein
MNDSTTPESAAPATDYMRIVRGRWRVLAATLIFCLAVAAVVALRAPRSYSATSDVLVTPVSSTDPDFVGISVLHDSAIAPTTSVLTVAGLVKTPQTTALALKRFPSGTSAADLDSKVSVSPLSQTSVVAITGTGSSPGDAAKVANAFALATIAGRTTVFQKTLHQTVQRLERQSAALKTTAGEAQRTALQTRLADLRPLLGQNDPSLQLLSPAVPAGAESSRRTGLVLAAAAVAGLLLGLLFVWLRELTDPRLRRSDQAVADLVPGGHVRAVGEARPGRGIPASFVSRLLAEGDGARTVAVLGLSYADAEVGSSALARAATRLRRRVVITSPGKALDGKADLTVLDCGSALEDPDALATAASTQATTVVARLDRTKRADLRELGQVLADAGIEPDGIILMRSAPREATNEEEGRQARPSLTVDLNERIGDLERVATNAWATLTSRRQVETDTTPAVAEAEGTSSKSA